MAAKTPDSSVGDAVFGQDNGLTSRRYAFITANIDDTDTFTTGITNIRHVAWEPVDATDLVALSYTAAGVITFATTGANHNGHLWIFSGAAR